MITLLTITGDRQHLFPRQERYMLRQTFPGGCRWVVVDDGEKPTECTLGQEYYRKEPGLPAKESFARNLRAGLEACRGSEFVFIIEDDDWYGPEYILNILPHLMEYDVVGERNARYYNVEHQCYKLCNNTEHASLCQTAFRGLVISELVRLIEEQSAFVDVRLWGRPLKRKLLNTAHCVGLKGQGGRDGIGMGHRPRNHWAKDPDGSKLIEWIGPEDASGVFEIGNLARRQRAERNQRAAA